MSRLALLSVYSICAAQAVEDLRGEARRLFAARQLEASDSAWSQVLARSPQDVEALLNYGVIEDMLGRYANARRVLEQADRLRPSSPQVLNNVAVNLVHLNRKAEAIKTLERSLRLEESNGSALDNLGTLYLDAARWPDAIQVWSKDAALEPNNPEIQAKLAIAHTRLAQQLLREKRLQESLAEFQSAIEANPSDLEPYLGATIALLRGGEKQGALATITEAHARAPQNLRVNLATGYVYESLEDWASAVLWYRRSVELDAASMDALVSLGRALRESGDNQKAIEALRKAVALNPRSASATYELGATLLNVETSKTEALDWLARAATLAPRRPEPNYLLAKAALQNNQLSQAESLVRAAVRADSHFPAAHYLLAQIYRKQNKSTEAKAELTTFERLKNSAVSAEGFDGAPSP